MNDLSYKIARVMPILLYAVALFVVLNGLLNTNNPARELFLASWLAVAASALAFAAKHLETRQ